jgi:hypothetical protein
LPDFYGLDRHLINDLSCGGRQAAEESETGGNITPMEGVTETKFGAEMKGWTMKISVFRLHLKNLKELGGLRC